MYSQFLNYFPFQLCYYSWIYLTKFRRVSILLSQRVPHTNVSVLDHTCEPDFLCIQCSCLQRNVDQIRSEMIVIHATRLIMFARHPFGKWLKGEINQDRILSSNGDSLRVYFEMPSQSAYGGKHIATCKQLQHKPRGVRRDEYQCGGSIVREIEVSADTVGLRL